MGTISLTLPADGETADASDVNTPFNTIAAVINGNIDADNLAAGAVTPEKLVSGAGTSWTWQSWTPTLSGRFDDAKWTKTCKYIQIGKTVHYRLKLVASTTTPMSGGSTDAQFTLPVTAASGAAGTEQSFVIGRGGIYDSGAGIYACDVLLSSSDNSKGRIRVNDASSTYSGFTAITSTVPITWTTSDEFTISGTYEAA